MAIGHACGVRVQKVQRVQRVQKVQRGRLKGAKGRGWRRKIKRGAPDGAGCIEGLCSLRSRGLSGLWLLRVVVSPSAMNMKSALRDSFSPPS